MLVASNRNQICPTQAEAGVFKRLSESTQNQKVGWWSGSEKERNQSRPGVWEQELRTFFFFKVPLWDTSAKTVFSSLPQSSHDSQPQEEHQVAWHMSFVLLLANREHGGLIRLPPSLSTEEGVVPRKKIKGLLLKGRGIDSE